MDYPKRIETIMEAFKVNQTGFSKLLEVSRGIISEFASGAREPSKDFLFGLSRLGISVDWFLTGEGSMFRCEGPSPSPGLGVALDEHNLVLAVSRVLPPDTDAEVVGKIINILKQARGKEAAEPQEPPEELREISRQLASLADRISFISAVPEKLRPVMSNLAKLSERNLAKAEGAVMAIRMQQDQDSTPIEQTGIA